VKLRHSGFSDFVRHSPKLDHIAPARQPVGRFGNPRLGPDLPVFFAAGGAALSRDQARWPGLPYLPGSTPWNCASCLRSIAQFDPAIFQ